MIKMKQKASNFFKIILISFLVLCFNSVAKADPISVFDSNGWIQIAEDDTNDTYGTGQFIEPGYGGQAFDAEYLFYYLQGTTLYLGLQSGFNLDDDGKQTYHGHDYYAGDLALTLNDAAEAQYAVDFGFDHSSTVSHSAGLYSVDTWGGADPYSEADPFAMVTGSFLRGIQSNWGFEDSSYYRVAAFDVADFGETFKLKVHWTMSCGNDVVEGSFNATTTPLPEPGTMLLLGSALLGIIGIKKKRTEKI